MYFVYISHNNLYATTNNYLFIRNLVCSSFLFAVYNRISNNLRTGFAYFVAHCLDGHTRVQYHFRWKKTASVNLALTKMFDGEAIYAPSIALFEIRYFLIVSIFLSMEPALQ